MKILAIETSCDETACAIVEDGHLVLADQVATQIEIHKKYGGVVPELASRNHVVDIVPVIRATLDEAALDWPDIDVVAVTRGPGLVGALLVGLQTAKAVAWAKNKALVPVNHLAGHLHAVHLHRAAEPRPRAPGFPHLALAVSGGHTTLYRVDGPKGPISRVANTRDDAVGEAFDKVARMLGLGYPGGPIIEQRAQDGDPKAHKFTLPRFKDGALDFSFSGLKTAVLTKLKGMGEMPEPQALADLVASFQYAAVEQLVDRTVKASKRQGIRDVVLVGGVACNGALRARMRERLTSERARLFVPPKRWCTDNAAMIAGAAFAHVERTAHAPADRRLNASGTWQIA